MSTVLELSTKELANCFSELALLIPKGSKDLPVGVDLQAGVLSFYYNTGCVYLHTFEVDTTAVEHCTVLFFNISDLLTATGHSTTKLEFSDNSLHIYDDTVDLHLRHGYSSVRYPEFPNAGYNTLPATIWKDSLQTVLNMGLDKVYAKALPITVASGTSVLKYPNTWVHCKTPALNLNRVLDIEHIRLITKFQPNAYQLLTHDSVLFKRGDAFLMLPCKQPNDLKETDDFFTATLEKMSAPITVNVANYTNSIRNLSKICTKAICNLIVYENGIKTVIDEAGASMSAICGETGKVIGTVQLPVNVWLVFLRALGTERIQILVGGDILCLRNQSLIILTHVRN